MKKKVMVFCDFYLPGFKSGGGMWTIVNLVDRFCDRYDFYIVTRNYDSKGDKTPYTSVKTDEWNRTGNANVFYFSRASVRSFARLVNEVKPDAVFLNSVFATPVIKFLTARRRGSVGDIPVILAPCGELSRNARSLKRSKKLAYLAVSRTFGLYDDILWKASFETEADEIREVFGRNVKVMSAPDLAPETILPEFSVNQKPEKTAGSARFIFLSRIVPKKNIKFLLECFAEIREGDVRLDIVGPAEDAEYWRECEALITKLPPNINVNVVGAVPYPEGLQFLTGSHFFAMPTLNENFGYVFLEALAAGCGLVISDQTVWNDLEEHQVGWAISLKTKERWIDVLKYCINMQGADFLSLAERAREYSLTWLADTSMEDATANVLSEALDG